MRLGQRVDYRWVIAFLNTMADVPIAVWGDLDAYGIQIVCDLVLQQ